MKIIIISFRINKFINLHVQILLLIWNQKERLLLKQMQQIKIYKKIKRLPTKSLLIIRRLIQVTQIRLLKPKIFYKNIKNPKFLSLLINFPNSKPVLHNSKFNIKMIYNKSQNYVHKSKKVKITNNAKHK